MDKENYAGESSAMSASMTPYLHILATELWLACWTLCSHRQHQTIETGGERLTKDNWIERLRGLHRAAVRLDALAGSTHVGLVHSWKFVGKSFLLEPVSRIQHHCIPRDLRTAVTAAKPPQAPMNVGCVGGRWVDRRQRSVRTCQHNLADLTSASFAEGDPRRSTDVNACQQTSLTGARNAVHMGLVPATERRLVETFSATLSLYRNLRSLHLEALVVDAPFRQAFSELSRLENLALYSCDIVARDGFVMNLRSFTISAQEPTARTTNPARGPLRIVNPDSVDTLHLDASDETAPLLAGFRGAQFPHLVVLSLQHLRDLDMFLAFLARCPGLEVLKIPTVHPDIIASLPQYTLSLDTIPALRNLAIHGEMLGFFSLNRPIDTVTIVNEPRPLRRRPLPAPVFTPTVLNDLLKTSGPLLSLSIPEISPTLELLNSIASLFPHLQQLSIHLTQPMLGRMTCCGYGRTRPTSADERHPVLHDADALNDIPEETLSDVEQDNPSSITRVIIDWICNGAASLLQEIEVLRFFWNKNALVSNLSPLQEHEVIATLGHLYAHLREVQIGPFLLWTREGTWRKSGTDSYLQVVL
ncbi:hypothetical protein C8R45DRAFT_1075462 [Mycena sanguinolenta]|nr:hypothetical protein C8R45DRAFT_1075462 [Mycena sanguinolenta]